MRKQYLIFYEKCLVDEYIAFENTTRLKAAVEELRDRHKGDQLSFRAVKRSSASEGVTYHLLDVVITQKGPRAFNSREDADRCVTLLKKRGKQSGEDLRNFRVVEDQVREEVITI